MTCFEILFMHNYSGYVASYSIISVGVESDAVSKLSRRVMQLNLTPHYADDEKTWPPFKLKTFTPLLLMHYKGQRNLKQANAVAELTCTGKIDDIRIPSMKSNVTKNVEEILAPLNDISCPCFILIEGPPGIGKSVLLKEISYRWANKQILQTYKLVLLFCLRDPMVQQAKSIDDLLQLYYKGDKRASEIISASSAQLFDNGGKDLTILLDGFDELPEDLQKNSLVANIIKRQVLPQCGLVLSSRPHASERFHNKATFIVEILGFTEKDRRHCIEQAFQGEQQKIEELSQYLDDYSHINSLCFVPFNMIVLVFLHKKEIPLPKNSTEMYNHFICLTICRYLAKCGHPLTNSITDLSNLPEPCNKIIHQLSTLALQALDQNKLVFTLDEVKVVCPDIEDIPGAINGFGLLQAVQHIGLTGRILTCHFVHFSIQEYLAAYCITRLSPVEELQILQDKFCHANYFNTFAIYVALTKGQRLSFKEYLSDGKKTINISQGFLSDVDLCLHLYHCFYEADDNEMCKSISRAKIFNNKSILQSISTPTHVEYLTLFLTTSLHHKWVIIYLGYIQDRGLHNLHRGLKSSNVTITELWLSDSGLTSSSSMLVSDIAIRCRVKRLALDFNETIGEREELYSMLSHPSSKLEALSIFKTKLSSRAANALFVGLEKNNVLQRLSIGHNDITDDTCPFIAKVIRLNSCLQILWMYGNPINAEAIKPILEALQFNNTLEWLRLPDYPNDVGRYIISMKEKINKMRKKSHEPCVKLQIDFTITTNGLFYVNTSSH